jgi:small subunit ribosomal protein S21
MRPQGARTHRSVPAGRKNGRLGALRAHSGSGRSFQKEGIPLVQIVVRDNNVEQALRALKKKMQREGTFREMKRRKFYEKPSEKKARQKAEAVRRARKLIRKRMQREGAV